MKSKRSAAVRSASDRKKKSSGKQFNSETSNVQSTKLCNTRINVVPSKGDVGKNMLKRKQGGSKTRNKQSENSATVRGKKGSSVKKYTQPLNDDTCESHSAAFSNEDSGTSFNTGALIVEKNRQSLDDNKRMNDLIESNDVSDEADSETSATFEVKDADDFIDGEDDEVDDEDNESTCETSSNVDFSTVDNKDKRVKRNRKMEDNDELTLNVDQPYEEDSEDSESDQKQVFPVVRDVAAVKERIRQTIEQLATFSAKAITTAAKRTRKSRSELMSRLASDIVVYYGYSAELAEYFLQMFKPAEAISLFEAMETPRPVTLRTNSLVTRRRDLAKMLISRGANVDPIGDWTKVGLKVIESSVPIGATPEYCSGHYMLQSASSFLPVLALDPRPEEIVLDMAAAPGGKSTYIGQLMKNTGVLFCNELKKERCASLVANIHRLGVTNTIIMNMNGLELKGKLPPLDRVLLDAPCSGLGVISRDLSVKVKRTPKDFKEQSTVQRQLLATAVDLVNPLSILGGIIVYSTCSLSIEENEEVIDYILKCRDVKVVPIDVELGEPGFSRYREKRFHPSIKHARRIYPHLHNMDGFFVCKLKKISNRIPERKQRDRRKQNNYVKDWGQEKWKPEFLNETVTFEEDNVKQKNNEQEEIGDCSSDDYDTEM